MTSIHVKRNQFCNTFYESINDLLLKKLLLEILKLQQELVLFVISSVNVNSFRKTNYAHKFKNKSRFFICFLSLIQLVSNLYVFYITCA